MSGQAFRFLHASDLHLERSIGGLTEIPNHLRTELRDAPLEALRAIVDVAIEEQVEFIVLAGDVVDPHQGGPRALAYLSEQFRRLAEADIAVYWAGGRVDSPERFPKDWLVADNVHYFATKQIEQIVHERDGEPIASVQGISTSQQKVRASSFHADPTGRFTIAIAYGQADEKRLQKSGVHYWALGGRHQRKTLYSDEHMAHYSGTPQGRSLSEAGAFGVTLVHVDEDHRLRTQRIATDRVRWHEEQIELSSDSTQEEFEGQLRDRLQGIADKMPDHLALVQLGVGGSGPLADRLRSGPLVGQLLEWLQAEYADKSPGPPRSMLSHRLRCHLPGIKRIQFWATFSAKCVHCRTILRSKSILKRCFRLDSRPV